jgi:hypothetical protein
MKKYWELRSWKMTLFWFLVIGFFKKECFVFSQWFFFWLLGFSKKNLNENHHGFHMRWRLFLQYGWFLQNLEKALSELICTQLYVLFLKLGDAHLWKQCFNYLLISPFNNLSIIIFSFQSTAIYQANQKLDSIKKAKENPVSSEELIKYAHRISASNAVSAPLNWQQG